MRRHAYAVTEKLTKCDAVGTNGQPQLGETTVHRYTFFLC